MGKMLSRRQMQHLCICLALGLLLCSLWQAAVWSRTQLHTGDAVCADTLRLHIRAASDSVADQNAKLRVRDAVLACLDAACPAGNQTDARSWAARNLFTLQLAARHALARCGVDAPVQVQLVNMYFPARQYTGGCLPAGRYDAVRITIGSGSGQNWWCVLYPGLCRLRRLCPAGRKRPGVRGLHPAPALRGLVEPAHCFPHHPGAGRVTLPSPAA